MTDRNPKTAECWNCDRRYTDVFKNEDNQIIGHCDSCKSDHVIVSAPKKEKQLSLEVTNGN